MNPRAIVPAAGLAASALPTVAPATTAAIGAAATSAVTATTAAVGSVATSTAGAIAATAGAVAAAVVNPIVWGVVALAGIGGLCYTVHKLAQNGGRLTGNVDFREGKASGSLEINPPPSNENQKCDRKSG